MNSFVLRSKLAKKQKKFASLSKQLALIIIYFVQTIMACYQRAIRPMVDIAVFYVCNMP